MMNPVAPTTCGGAAVNSNHQIEGPLWCTGDACVCNSVEELLKLGLAVIETL